MQIEPGGIPRMRAILFPIGYRSATRMVHCSRIFFVLGAFMLVGCRPKPPPRPPGEYFGPTESIYDVVAAVNANNRKLPTLIADGTFEASLVESPGKPPESFNGTIRLIRQKPRGLRLVASKDVLASFEVGSNDDEFWFFRTGDTLYRGTWASAGNNGSSQLPIRPELLGEVLGISDIDDDLKAGDMPVMRFSNTQNVYALLWVSPRSDRVVATKEIWFDRATKRPKLVTLFDENGRIVLNATLGNYIQAEIDGQPKASWPTIAGRYDLFFPETGSRMRIDLASAYRDEDGLPNAASFAFPTPQRSKTKREINLDESR